MTIEWMILDGLQKIHTPVPDALMCFITGLGNAGILWIGICVLLLLLPRYRKAGVLLGAALLVDVILCNGLLKHLFARVRPCEINTAVQLLIPRPADFSFPSGHTAASFAAVTALFLAGEKRLWKIALPVAPLIAFSRLYLYVHYPRAYGTIWIRFTTGIGFP